LLKVFMAGQFSPQLVGFSALPLSLIHI